MKNNKVKIGLLTLSVLIVTATAGISQEFQKSAAGIMYKFHKTVKTAPKPVAGDLVTLSMVYKTQSDSVVFDSRKNKYDFTYTIASTNHAADLNHALLMMGKGDSATFILRADSFYLGTLRMKKVPSFIRKGGNLTFHIKLLSIKSGNEVLQEQVDYMKEMKENSEKGKFIEKDSLSKYLTRSKITVAPTASGLYYISLLEGTGEQPKMGNKVKVHYRGTFTNGKVFDSSYDSGAPLEFKIGGKQVIRGFEEGVILMKKGGRSKLVIPSALGYGENAAGEIPPFTTLIFEIELLEIN